MRSVDRVPFVNWKMASAYNLALKVYVKSANAKCAKLGDRTCQFK